MESQRISSKIGKGSNIGQFNCDWLLTPYAGSHPPINDKQVAGDKLQAAVMATLELMHLNRITPPPNYGQNAGYDGTCATSYAGAKEELVYWHHPDHLGSSSFITGLDGEVNQNIEYFPSGEVFVENHKNSYNTPYKFNGKELDGETGYYYYHARYYNPRTSIWLNVDPLAGNTPSWSPYRYGFNNPLRFIDPDGMSEIDDLEVEKQKNGTYKVTGGTANFDKNIYVMENGKRTGEVIGKTLTEYSFHDDQGKAISGAIINPNDQSGANFMNKEIPDLDLANYIPNATGGKTYDFKTRSMNNRPNGMSKDQYKYRGMPFEGIAGFDNQDKSTTTFASARDIGNVGAGYVAGNNGLVWGVARLGFDALQSYQQRSFATEGQPTKHAQRIGHNMGIKRYVPRLSREATTPWPRGPKY